VYSLKKEYTRAIEQYKEIIRLLPDDAEGYFGMANTYMMQSKFDDALMNAKKALDIYEETGSNHIADGYHLVGLISYYNGDDEGARDYLTKAKDKGAKLNADIESQLFTKESKSKYTLEKDEDYVKYEQDVIDGYDWLLNTPIGVDAEKRAELGTFLMRWMVGSPTVSLELSAEIVTYMDCAPCLMIFMGGWTKYALESNGEGNKLQGMLVGTENMIKFYNTNKEELGKNKDIEKLLKLQEENKLKEFLKKNS
jgi:tetratricopeptide (TPR) repeat protein